MFLNIYMIVMVMTSTVLAFSSANSETGIKMLKKLNSMDQSIENMQNVKVALVECAAAGDCSQEAAAMPALAMYAEEEATATPEIVSLSTDFQDLSLPLALIDTIGIYFKDGHPQKQVDGMT
jgi:hypothetical protein